MESPAAIIGWVSQDKEMGFTQMESPATIIGWVSQEKNMVSGLFEIGKPSGHNIFCKSISKYTKKIWLGFYKCGQSDIACIGNPKYQPIFLPLQ